MQTATEIYHNHKNPLSKVKGMNQQQLFDKSEADKKKKPSKYGNKWIIIDGINSQADT